MFQSNSPLSAASVKEETDFPSFFEIQSKVALIKPVSVRDTGNQTWTKIHQTMSKLNIQAHLQVQNQVQESIVSEIISQNKTRDILSHLLCIETWKEKVFPLLAKDLATHDNVRAYFMLYHEATSINLLELILYQKEAVESLGQLQVDLIDYCVRKIRQLNIWYYHKFNMHRKEDQEKPTATNAQEALTDSNSLLDLERTRKEMDFTVAINSLSILRYITDVVFSAPLSVMTRLLKDHDVICSLVYLIEKAPWLRSFKKMNSFEKFEDGRWKTVSKEDVLLLGKVEAQIWLSLYNLLLEPECQKAYNYNTNNHMTVLKVC